MHAQDAEALVTGATGFIGRWLLIELTARGRPVAALVRGARARERALRAFVDARGGDGARLFAVEGALERPGLGLEQPLPSVRFVYHLAARFAFGLSPAEARAANVQGALEAARWARAQRSIERFVLLGGYRMTRPERALEAFSRPLDEREALALYRGRGAYEVSKHEGYHRTRAFAAQSGLPWTAVHPSTVIGDSRTGETTQLVGLGETAQRLFERKMPAMVGGANTLVPLVTVDHLARVLATVVERRETEGSELVVLDPQTPVLPALVRRMAARLGVPAPRITLPARLVAALPKMLTGVDPESLAFISDDRYDTESAEAHARAAGIVAPDIQDSVDRWCDYLVSVGFRPGRSARG